MRTNVVFSDLALELQEKAREIAEKYQISAIPTVIVFKGGEVLSKFYGLTSRDDLAGALGEAAD